MNRHTEFCHRIHNGSNIQITMLASSTKPKTEREDPNKQSSDIMVRKKQVKICNPQQPQKNKNSNKTFIYETKGRKLGFEFQRTSNL